MRENFLRWLVFFFHEALIPASERLTGDFPPGLAGHHKEQKGRPSNFRLMLNDDTPRAARRPNRNVRTA